MKKIFAIVLSIILVVPSLAFSAAAADENVSITRWTPCPHKICVHDETSCHMDTVVLDFYRWSSISDTTHALMECHRHACIICGNNTEYWMQIDTESHSFGSYMDAGHLTGGRHRYTQSCPVCKYTRTMILACSGPPCYVPASLGPIGMVS